MNTFTTPTGRQFTENDLKIFSYFFYMPDGNGDVRNRELKDTWELATVRSLITSGYLYETAYSGMIVYMLTPRGKAAFRELIEKRNAEWKVTRTEDTICPHGHWTPKARKFCVSCGRDVNPEVGKSWAQVQAEAYED